MEGVWISCTVYFAAGNIRREAFIDTRSVSVEVEFSPKVADAHIGSASITSAMLASNPIEVVPCTLSEVMMPGPKKTALIWIRQSGMRT